MYLDCPASPPMKPPRYFRPSVVILISVSEKTCSTASSTSGFTTGHDFDAFG